MSAVPKVVKNEHAYIRASLRLAAEAIASGDWATAKDIYQEVGAIGVGLETIAEELLEGGRL